MKCVCVDLKEGQEIQIKNTTLNKTLLSKDQLGYHLIVYVNENKARMYLLECPLCGRSFENE